METKIKNSDLMAFEKVRFAGDDDGDDDDDDSGDDDGSEEE